MIIMHADNRTSIEEESIIKLFPALLQVAKENTPDELKAEWRKKLIAASFAIKTQHDENPIEEICSHISDYSKRSVCLVILFLIAGSDKHIDPKEITFIVEKVAKLWNYSVEELICLLQDESERLFIPQKIIEHLKNLP
ncbi:MAG: TerB family tellurite resistance protein [Spirochaetales bacterium]|nr:TerB family tellurite resistance protein [Spirochaetales bacterium]